MPTGRSDDAELFGLPPRFQIDGEIGRGGMGVVYRAHDQHLGRFVAIKVLSLEWSHSVGTERFQREIALMARLVHPGIVALFDSGLAGGRLYYVMPFVAGETLRARLVRERRVNPQDSAAICADVAEALAYAHGLGIVHRDVKPENIFVVSGRAVLADFGIARMMGSRPVGASETTAFVTTAGDVLGTVAYMSPEQASGDPGLDGRADLYSLGCVLYELVTGVAPFAGPTSASVLAKHLTVMPPAPSAHGVPLPSALDAVVLHLLAKSPADRPQSAAAAARALRTATQGNPPDRAATPAASEADRLVAKGLAAFNRFGATGGSAAATLFDEAKTYLTRAVALDPTNARGLCGLGNVHYVAAAIGLEPEADALARGRELIFAALAADDHCAEVHCSLGKIALYLDDDFHAAARHIRRAIDLEPASTEALRLLSIVYKILGRADEALGAARSATERIPDSAPLWNTLGDALLAAGRNAEAVDALKRAIGLLPAYGPALERLERAWIALGEMDRALEVRSSRMRVSGQRDRAELLERDAEAGGVAAAIQGDIRRELDEWIAHAHEADPFHDIARNLADRIIGAHAQLGQWREAMDWVQRAYDRRPGRLRRLLADMPVDYRGLAVDPRFARLLRVAGMEDLL